MDPSVDSLAVLGNVLEEFMDVGPKEESAYFDDWVVDRERVVSVLERSTGFGTTVAEVAAQRSSSGRSIPTSGPGGTHRPGETY